MPNTQTYIIYYFFTAIAMLGCISTFCVCVHTLKRIYKSEKEAKIKLIPIPREVDDLYQDKIKSTVENLNVQRTLNKELEDKYIRLKVTTDHCSKIMHDSNNAWRQQLEYLIKELNAMKINSHVDMQTIENIKDKINRINKGEGVYTA